MKQYKVHFLSSESLVLNQEDFSSFMAAYSEDGLNSELRGFMREDKTILIRRDNITWIESEDADGEAKVINPLTPAAVREEKKAEVANQPVTLNDQLSNPDLGNGTV